MIRPNQVPDAKLPLEVEEYIDNQLKSGNLIFELPTKFYKHKELIGAEYMAVGWQIVQIRAAGQPDVREYYELRFVK